MIRRLVSALGRTLSGIAAAIRARPGFFLAAVASLLVLNVLLPPLVLSVARKRVDFFTFNPWLKSLPSFLASGDISLGHKLDFLLGLAVFWFSSDGVFGIEWGYAVTFGDLLRFLVMSVIFGAYFAVWAQRTRTDPSFRSSAHLGRGGGRAGEYACAVYRAMQRDGVRRSGDSSSWAGVHGAVERHGRAAFTGLDCCHGVGLRRGDCQPRLPRLAGWRRRAPTRASRWNVKRAEQPLCRGIADSCAPLTRHARA